MKFHSGDLNPCSACWAAMQQSEQAARTLVELHRGLAERRAATQPAA
jgi:hypothetical protein